MVARIFVCALLLATYGGNAAHANDSAVSGVGGTVRPMENHPSIRMVEEEIRVKLPERTVETRFVFRNEGPATSVLMGFPEEGYGDIVPARTGFRYFRSSLDGRPIKTDRRVASETNDHQYHFWWVKRVPFGRNQTRTVTNSYQSGLAEDSLGNNWFTYVLETGAPWKGKIGKARIVVDVSGLREKWPVSFKPSGYVRQGHKVIWDLRDIEPKENIHVDWFDAYLNVKVNGDTLARPSESGRFGGNVRTGRLLSERKGDRIRVSLGTAADCLGGSLTEGRDGEPAVLTRGDRSVHVHRWSRYLRTDEGRIEMPDLAEGAKGFYVKKGDTPYHTMVDLASLVAALGGTARFDQKGETFLVWLKPATPGRAGS